MFIAFSSGIALLVVAANLQAESAILLCQQKDLPKLTEKLKCLGYVLVAFAVAFAAVGGWFHYHSSKLVPPNAYFSLAVTLFTVGIMIFLKGERLKQNQPNRLGQILRYSVPILLIVSVGLLVLAVARAPISS